jgi:pimeloyl-ACP methyl ester carboxylesterase
MQLHFRSLGTGRPVIILHGLFGSSGNWQTFGKSLAAAGYRVVLPDLRNHGRSPHSEMHTYEAMAGDVRELIGSENLSRDVLACHSMGGKTAMQVALEDPQSIAGLLSIDMAPGAYAHEHHEVADTLAELDVRNIRGRMEADDLLAGRIPDDGTRQFLLKNLYRTQDGLFDWRFNLEALQAEIGNMRHAVTEGRYEGPALFVRGEKSDYIGPDREKEINRLFPKATIETAPGAGHWVHVDAPEWLRERMIRFLDGLG